MTDPVHSVRARAALAAMPSVDPAIAALALWCTHRDTETATRSRGDCIFYGLDFETRPLSEQTGLLAHHVLHVALRHSARSSAMATREGPAFAGDLFNLACDAIVNETLLQAGHALPRPAVRLSELLEHRAGMPLAPSPLLAEWSAERLYMHLSETRAGQSRRDSARRYAHARDFSPDLDPEQDSAPDPDRWRGRLDQALTAGRSAGAGIGATLTAFGDLPGADTPWEVLLRRLVTRAVTAHPRRSHRRPARRWIALDAEARTHGGAAPVFEPGLARDDRRPRLVIGLDTSSSVNDRQFTHFARETRAIAQRTGAEGHLLGFDSEVHTNMRLSPHTRFPDIRMRRGGGTAFAEVIEVARALRPSVLVMLTDLDGPVGPAPPFPVIWAVPVPATPPFGRCVTICA
ncbi:MAG: VWA-like domain-containing protein [Pseudomonadota bacterium]